MKAILIVDEYAKGKVLQRGLNFEGCFAQVILWNDFVNKRLAKDNRFETRTLIYSLEDWKKLEEIDALDDQNYFHIAILSQSDFELSSKISDKLKAVLTMPINYQQFVLNLRIWFYEKLSENQPKSITLEGLTLDYDARKIRSQHRSYFLSNKEFSLMYFLMSNPRKILSRITILENVWDINAMAVTNTVDVHISKLRKVLKILQVDPNTIKTVPCGGYLFGEI